jgi:hypothetical protein
MIADDPAPKLKKIQRDPAKREKIQMITDKVGTEYRVPRVKSHKTQGHKFSSLVV